MTRKDIIGEKFGRLTVIEDAGFVSVGNKGERKRVYKCDCDCGEEIIVKRNSLTTNHTKSCGCLEVESKKTTNLKHGLRNHNLYSTWLNIKDRCNNIKNSHYKHYGGKGIKMCETWTNDFKSFYDWALSSGWKAGLSIERTDNEKGYNPNNCSWIQPTHQAKNRTISIMITRNGVTKCLSDWCKELNVNSSTAYSRLRRGWNNDDLFKK